MNDYDCPAFKLMSKSEAEREMASYFREGHEQKAAEQAAKRAADLVLEAQRAAAKTVAKPEAEVELSPQMQALKDKLLVALYSPKKPSKSINLPAVLSDLKKEERATTSAEIHDSRVELEMGVIPLKVATESKDVVAVELPATETTRFPVNNVLAVKKFDDSYKLMADLCAQLLTHNDYLRVRDEYCHLSLRLNLIGKLAPAYRPTLKAGAVMNSEVYQLINRDQIVIDLHWCHATKMVLMPQEATHAALFREDVDFCFDVAWVIALKKWKKGYRAVEALCLTTLQQCQMLTLRSPELEALSKSLGSGWRESKGASAGKLATVKRLVCQWAECDKRIAPRRDEYTKLWVARELLGRETSNQQIALLHAFMVGGEVKDRTSIRDMLKSLDKHVPLTFSPK